MSEQEIALRQRQHVRGLAVRPRRRPHHVGLRSRRRIFGSASFSTMSRLPTARQPATAGRALASRQRAGRQAAWLTKTNAQACERTAVGAEHRPRDDRLRRGNRRVGVAHLRPAMKPPLITISGLTPKNAGFHSTRSASLPTSTDPTSCAMPCVMAGLIVYFAM